MIGRWSARSTATPCAFIETSIAPLLAPRTARASGSSQGCGDSTGSGNARTQASAAVRVARALPIRPTTRPISGSATITPTARARMTSPRVAFERSNRA